MSKWMSENNSKWNSWGTLLPIHIQQVQLAFQKFTQCRFAFIKDSSVFANWKNSEEDLGFYENRWKTKVAFGICFARRC